MRSTLLPVFLLQGAALAPVALAVQLYNADVPAACVPICAPIVQLTDLCTVAPAAPVPVASSIRTITTATTRATGASSARATEDNHGGSKGTSSGAAASAHNSAEDNTARTGAAATATSHAGEDNLARIGDDSNHGSTSHGSTTTAVASVTAAVSENIPAPTGGDSSGQPSGNHGGEAESHGGSSGENHSGKRRLRRQNNSITAQCFCSNRSFDVRAVAGLCASCLRQNGVRAGNGKLNLSRSVPLSPTTHNICMSFMLTP